MESITVNYGGQPRGRLLCCPSIEFAFPGGIGGEQNVINNLFSSSQWWPIEFCNGLSHSVGVGVVLMRFYRVISPSESNEARLKD